MIWPAGASVLSPTGERGGGYLEWNFYQYLVNRKSAVVARFPSRTDPDDPQPITAIEKQ